MKKYVLLLLSVLLFAVTFAVCWYHDHLFSVLYLFVASIYFALFVCFVILLVCSIVSIVKRTAYLNFATIAVLALLVELFLLFPFRDARVRWELNRYEADRLKIVDMLRDDRLQPTDPYGNIELPDGYRCLSSDGTAYLYQNDENGQVICFWVYRGVLGDAAEVIYSSGGEELIRSNRINIMSLEKLKDHWYYVITN